jgi:hypothetical protein
MQTDEVHALVDEDLTPAEWAATTNAPDFAGIPWTSY